MIPMAICRPKPTAPRPRPRPRPKAAVSDVIAYARTRPIGRVALGLVLLGDCLATGGMTYLYVHLKRHPLVPTDSRRLAPLAAGGSDVASG
ncbi:MAG TPA: hypothetical protein VIS06_22065 [Mycobacteriales bacterium]